MGILFSIKRRVCWCSGWYTRLSQQRSGFDSITHQWLLLPILPVVLGLIPCHFPVSSRILKWVSSFQRGGMNPELFGIPKFNFGDTWERHINNLVGLAYIWKNLVSHPVFRCKMGCRTLPCNLGCKSCTYTCITTNRTLKSNPVLIIIIMRFNCTLL